MSWLKQKNFIILQQYFPKLQLFQQIVLFQCSKSSFLLNFSKYAISHPILKPLIRPFIKKFVFSQFCGGETLDECLPLVQELHSKYQIQSMIDHSTEEFETEDMFQENVHIKLSLLNKLANTFPLQQVRFIPIKCTALIHYELLETLTSIIETTNANIYDSTFSPLSLLSVSQQQRYEAGLQRCREICLQAKELQYSILLDAEQSHRQPAIEYTYRLLAKEFNQTSSSSSSSSSSSYPVIYNTYQTYLLRTKQALQQDLMFCQRNNIIFAIKLVRGAYMKTESDRSNQMHTINPIHPSKEETDRCYDEVATMLVQEIARSDIQSSPKISLLAATHNRDSIQLIADQMQIHHIPKNYPFIRFAQILGMCDHMTMALGKEGYNISKLILFGDVNLIMPWLIRRLEENQDGLGAVQQDLSDMKQSLLSSKFI